MLLFSWRCLFVSYYACVTVSPPPTPFISHTNLSLSRADCRRPLHRSYFIRTCRSQRHLQRNDALWCLSGLQVWSRQNLCSEVDHTSRSNYPGPEEDLASRAMHMQHTRREGAKSEGWSKSWTFKIIVRFDKAGGHSTFYTTTTSNLYLLNVYEILIPAI
jgi:hypothetical protein